MQPALAYLSHPSLPRSLQGRLTLLLGPPSSGKSTLLLALAGKATSDLKLTGDILYNGHRFDEFVAKRTAAYVPQNDKHIGELTVRETLDFAAQCQGVGDKEGRWLPASGYLGEKKGAQPDGEQHGSLGCVSGAFWASDIPTELCSPFAG